MFWTIPPLSEATEGPWITPRGCQPKKRQEGLLVFQAKTVCSQRWNPDSKRVGVHQQSAYFIHRVAINFFVFRGTTPTSLWFVCPCYYLGWVAVKMFGFKKKKKKRNEGWLVRRRKRVEALQSLSGLGAGSNSISKKHTHGAAHSRDTSMNNKKKSTVGISEGRKVRSKTGTDIASFFFFFFFNPTEWDSTQ